MDQIKLKHLLARHTVADMDKLDFVRRVSSEHLFTSIPEAIEYVRTATINREENSLDPMYNMSYKTSPVLVINVIDEAVSSIIYELFFCKDRQSPDTGYYEHLISEFRDDISNAVHKKGSLPFYYDLYIMFKMIDYLAFPIDRKEAIPLAYTKVEEEQPGQLSKAYYTLMNSLYRHARPKDVYLNRLEMYYQSRRF